LFFFSALLLGLSLSAVGGELLFLALIMRLGAAAGLKV